MTALTESRSPDGKTDRALCRRACRRGDPDSRHGATTHLARPRLVELSNQREPRLSAIDDLIAQVQEPRLREQLKREQLKREWAEAQKTKKFGLVFDRHLPEFVPIGLARRQRGDLTAEKGGSLTGLWRVQCARGDMVRCVRSEGTPGRATLELAGGRAGVRQFGETIFPAPVPMIQIQDRPADAPCFLTWPPFSPSNIDK
jgi:hypothetical protein